MEVTAVFGEGLEHSQLADLLIKFYNDHDLKRDIDSISDSVRYHIKPSTHSQDKAGGVLDIMDVSGRVLPSKSESSWLVPLGMVVAGCEGSVALRPS